MSHLPSDFFGLRRLTLRTGKLISAKAVFLVGMTLFALGGLSASAQAFTLSNSGALTIESGHYKTFTVTATPTGSFSENLLINCTSLPANAECFYPNSSNSLAVSGSAASMTIILDTSTIYQYESRSTPAHRNLERVALCSLFAPALALLLLGRRRGFGRSPLLRMMVFTLALLPLAGLAGCASTKPAVTPPGAYAVTVNGSYGPYNANTTFSLTVTP